MNASRQKNNSCMHSMPIFWNRCCPWPTWAHYFSILVRHPYYHYTWFQGSSTVQVSQLPCSQGLVWFFFSPCDYWRNKNAGNVNAWINVLVVIVHINFIYLKILSGIDECCEKFLKWVDCADAFLYLRSNYFMKSFSYFSFKKIQTLIVKRSVSWWK